jgi:hypothetical protein
MKRIMFAAVIVLTALVAAPIVVAPADASITLSSWIRYKYPKQVAATQSSAAATKRWALLIGINTYAYPTVANIGSRQDAETLYSLLIHLGWRSDHIILMRDRDATAAHIIDGIRWLALKSNTASTSVFHYSGHENYRLSSTDEDGRDIAIWAADNRYIYERELGVELGRINAYHMWIDISTCRAAGFDEPGMVKAGRILTFSSAESQLSYEAPPFHHSAFAWYEIYDGMYLKFADTNHDGKVTVEEAYAWSRPYVIRFTSKRQYPAIIDKVSGSMFLNL